ncbi:hypothetical protein [Propionivibrio sp.]|uniref:hypothetical protein n=1 Tax=Propionivibrio sp. TaxID=2212460 RepID=UPI003BEFCB66
MMPAAHKNDCPVAAGQIAKTITKHTADFIAFTWRFTVNLVRLKNIGLALWVTRYEMAPANQTIGATP